MKIAAMMRVKNESRWLAEVLSSIQPLTTDILVFDDHSTDDTVRIAEAMGCDVMRSPYQGLDEARDKNFLLPLVRTTYEPDYVLAIDGDEVLQEGAADLIRAQLDRDAMTAPSFCQWRLFFKYLWNDRQTWRADGCYGRPYWQWRIFSLVHQTGRLFFPAAAKPGPNFHCGNIPQGLKGQGGTIEADILHLGYMDREDRIRKYRWYNEVDPKNHREDCYRHMVLGDLPELPAEMKRVHAGPLELRPIPPELWPLSRTVV